MISMDAIEYAENGVQAMPTDFRRDVLARLKRLNMTKYQLAEELTGEVSRNSIYSFLRDENPSEIGSNNLQRILNLLEKIEAKRALNK